MARFLFFAALFCLLSSHASRAIVFEEFAVESGFEQGQVFYSQTVSRVTDGAQHACMISTGSNWKNKAQARRAVSIDAMLGTGKTLETAFAQTAPVAVQGLNSNTPFVSIVVPSRGEPAVRVATGFAIAPGSLEVGVGAGAPEARLEGFEVEPRGDTAISANATTVASVLSAFERGEEINVLARSSKTGGLGEHFVRYAYEGRLDMAAYHECLEDLESGRDTLNAGHAPVFSLASSDDLSPSARQAVRGMACNRELDPNGAELFRFSGVISGFATPLDHALVRYDEHGNIAHAWSGDLWKISRTKRGYELAVSNSISRQGPMSVQQEKACTRYAKVRCATVQEIAGELVVGSCFDEYLGGTGLAAGFAPGLGGGFLDPLGIPVSSFSTVTGGPGQTTTSSGSSSIFLASSGGSGGSFVRVVQGGGEQEPSNETSTFTVVNGSDPEDDSVPNIPELSSIPLPAAGLLLALILPMGLLLRRRSL